MYKLKDKYEGKNFTTLLPDGTVVSLNGKPVTRKKPGNGDRPPSERTIPGITQKQIEKYKDHKKFKQFFDKYFTEAESSKADDSKSKGDSKASSKTSEKSGSSTSKTDKKAKGGDSKGS